MTTTRPQAPAHPNKLLPGDYLPMIRLENGMTEALTVKETSGGRAVQVPAEGYVFPWGVIAERLSGMLMVFDFHLDDLQDEYKRHGRTPTELKERMFAGLEQITGHARQESLAAWNPLSPGQAGWALLPGTLGKAAVFTAVCHVGVEPEFRQWLISDLLSAALPELIRMLYGDVEAGV
jgi:hypothetical protein